ncbi:hypothetical protein [Luteolibacter sp. Populi]|uniref:hypothetical protein n=1 Tax=Luteolibacter sp. Populi TaxID=3230487 RepID=UPI0034667C55
MKKRIVIAGILLLIVIFAWRQNRGGQADHGKASASTHHPGSGDEASVATDSSLPGKSGNRKDPAPLPTHGPHRFKDFFLPEVDVTGLNLAAALDKLQAAYVEVCGQTGEVPLQLAFDVPPGHGKPLRIKLGLRTLDSSVRFLAAAAGLKVKRDGATYHFEAPQDSGKRVTKTLLVRPDLISLLKDANVSGSDLPFDVDSDPVKVRAANDIRRVLEDCGIDLAASTQLTLTGGSWNSNPAELRTSLPSPGWPMPSPV